MSCLNVKYSENYITMMSIALLRKKNPCNEPNHPESFLFFPPHQQYNPMQHSLQFTAFNAEPLCNTSNPVSERGKKGQNKEHCLKRPFNSDKHLKPISLKTKRLHST